MQPTMPCSLCSLSKSVNYQKLPNLKRKFQIQKTAVSILITYSNKNALLSNEKMKTFNSLIPFLTDSATSSTRTCSRENFGLAEAHTARQVLQRDSSFLITSSITQKISSGKSNTQKATGNRNHRFFTTTQRKSNTDQISRGPCV